MNTVIKTPIKDNDNNNNNNDNDSQSSNGLMALLTQKYYVGVRVGSAGRPFTFLSLRIIQN